MWRFCHTGISIVILGFLSVFLFAPVGAEYAENAFWYLIALQIVTESLQITLGFFGYHTLCGYFSVAGVLQTTLFYPVIGFGLDRYLEEQSFFGWKMYCAIWLFWL